jgi:cobalt-zinc-cadmium efflux system membrane fusion protein
MKKMSTVFALTGVLALGCDRQPEKPAEKVAAPETAPSGPKEETGHADAAVVKVDPAMRRDLRVTTAAVESRSGDEEVRLLGALAVDERAYAEVSAPVAARVVRLSAHAGDSVRAGSALAELSSPELGRARAEYLSARARVQLAGAALERKRNLAAERIAPLREVQEAEAAAAEAQAALRSARASVLAFGVAVPAGEDTGEASTFTLRSPVSGVVIERTAVMGQMLDPAAPAFRIGNLSTLWLTVHAFERDAVRVRPGAPARLTFAALPGQSFPGAVALVGQQVETESNTVPVRIDVVNRGHLLRPGMSASAAVPVGPSGARILTVPVAAVQRVRNEWCVFLPKDASTFEIRKIGRGGDLGGEVEILTGLRAGETIVVDGAFLLKAQAEKGEAGHGGH